MQLEMDILLYALGGIAALSGLIGVGYYSLKKPKKELPSPQTPSRKDYKSLEDALSKTKAGFWGKLAKNLSGKDTISKKELDDIEEALYTSDLGPKTVDYLISQV